MTYAEGRSPQPQAKVTVQQVDVRLLKGICSPRLAGVDKSHSQLLAQAESELPPILVHRPTMRVLDGIHRLDAALQRGQDTISAVFHDGTLEEGFAEAVRSNVRHGLPLSLAEREAAATRLLTAFPTWSDRAVAATVGLSSKTIASLRTRRGLSSPERRVGRDGRVRPTDGGSGRRAAAEFIARNPDASLREIALAAGISPVTARDVRLRLSSDADVVMPRQRRQVPGRLSRVRGGDRAVPASSAEEPEEILRHLQHDPSLRFNESGRTLLRWLAPRVFGSRKLLHFADRVPPHARYTLANLARACADEWRMMAETLDEQTVGEPAFDQLDVRASGF